MNKFFCLLCSFFLISLSGRASARPYKVTILAYMNGYEKVIDPVVERLINQMEQSGSDDSMAIIAKWGSLRSGKTKKLFIENDQDLTRVNSRVLSESEEDMGKASTLESFLLWGAREYPAETLIVILGGHGSGWSGFSYDDRSKSRISMPDFGKVMKKLARERRKKTDLVVFDACVMSMLEVASEISQSVKFMAAGMDKLPDEDWIPYQNVFDEIRSSGGTEPEVIGTIFARSYYESTKGIRHSGGILGIQFGVVDLSKLKNIERLNQVMVSRLSGLPVTDQEAIISLGRAASQKYFVPYYVDFGEWLSHLPKEPRFLEISRVSEQLSAATKSALVYQSKTSFYPNSTGLTISFLPATKPGWQARYLQLRWAKKTKWQRFIAMEDDND